MTTNYPVPQELIDDWRCQVCEFNGLAWSETFGICHCIKCTAPYKSLEDGSIEPVVPQWALEVLQAIWVDGGFGYNDVTDIDLLEEGLARRLLTLADVLLLASQPLADASSCLLASGIAGDAIDYWDYLKDLEDALNAYNNTVEIVSEVKESYRNDS